MLCRIFDFIQNLHVNTTMMQVVLLAVLKKGVQHKNAQHGDLINHKNKELEESK